ncbi:MAG: DNA-directed DNA polymerase I [Candidatus Bathyarchaeota archaeon]|jgi:DNA polymerase I|nr:DNA-directed DNA polymerase I [Candidatus Bathyarchaeota archaeon A05DMB-5]MDH7557050.1 DNA-directed DNA polymerase I [Candidatus Bathyarchaeota archaeon]
MAQRRLEDFSKVEAKPLKENEAEALPFTETIIKEKKEYAFPPLAPDNLPPSYFVSATYDGKTGKALIKLYEPHAGKIYFWYDNTGHKPYCLTNLSQYELEKITRLTQHEGFDHFEIVEKFDPLSERNVKVTKIVAKDPLAVGGRPTGCIRDIIPEDFPKVSETPIEPEKIKVWESKIKYYQSYIYDRNLQPGMLYEVKNGDLVPKSLEDAERMVHSIREIFKEATDEELQYIEQWARLLEYSAPKFHRVALDIEVYTPVPTRMPDPREAAYPIVCVSLYGSDGQKKVLLLKREGIREGTECLPADVTLEYFDSEEKLIRAVFDALWNYPFALTFNGDDFDLRYLAHRALNFGFKRSEIPIEVGRRVCLLKYGVHIDLYKFFFNRSIQIYAFNNRYRDVTLDDVGKALIGMEKIKLEKSLGELSYTELAQYCFRDAEITFKLTSFEDELVMKLILVLARISSMPMEDVSRQGVSRWIRNFMHHEHRRKNMLIPNMEDILAVKGKTVTKAIIKGKKYKGAIVVEPTPGVHFNVAVMDFPSLYPSIIKVWNLGYQSILCQHQECRSNLIPDTPHWVCTKKRALESLLIGSLRDLRVQWYKPKTKDKTLPNELRSWYNLIQGALKVILNASYGVFGAETFDLYCPPVAEATAAIARHSLTQILNKAEQLGIQVLYGDTDSIFLKNPSKEQIEKLAHWTEHELKMSLDVDKVYRYSVFSSRKKNYLGVFEDGSVDVKGLTGKKKHIPPFIKKAFDRMKERLATVKTPADFENAKKDISQIIRDCYMRLKRREWESLNDLAFNVVLGEELERYTKTTPQHVKAAKILKENGVELRAGDLISFVKVAKEPHVKPVELATNNEIDVDKYIAYLHSTFDQVLDALGLDFDEIIGLTKLERFM